MFKELFNESIQKLSDEKMDQAINGKDVITFKYSSEAAQELGIIGDVYITKDRKFMHVKRSADVETVQINLKLKEI